MKFIWKSRSYIICHIWYVTYDMSHMICHIWYVAWYLHKYGIWNVWAILLVWIILYDINEHTIPYMIYHIDYFIRTSSNDLVIWYGSYWLFNGFLDHLYLLSFFNNRLPTIIFWRSYADDRIPSIVCRLVMKYAAYCMLLAYEILCLFLNTFLCDHALFWSHL